MKRSDIFHAGGGALSRFLAAAPAALLLAGLIPATAVGQGVLGCAPQISVDIEDKLYFLNEPIAVTVNLGAGTVTQSQSDPPDDYLDIFSFTYQMDCTAGDTWPDCTAAGNAVQFTGVSSTDCVDENGAAITFDTSVVNQQITFTPTPGTAIRNFSEQTCPVNFGIVVTGVANDNEQREITELTGWAAADSECGNGVDPVDAAASASFQLSSAGSLFHVTKDFTDDNPMGVDVHLRCRAGIEPEQDFTITDPDTDGLFDFVNFLVRDYPLGSLNCSIFEDPIPEGYVQSYLAGAIDDSEADLDQDETGCIFENVVNGQFTCAITNTPAPGEFTVHKQFEQFGQPTFDYEETARIVIRCDSEILEDGARYDPQSGFWVIGADLGDDESLTVKVDTTGGPANCHAIENVTVSAIEATHDCDSREIPMGSKSECTFVNTVWFEGIPALDARGLALLALLMLGTGLFAYRRFG